MRIKMQERDALFDDAARWAYYGMQCFIGFLAICVFFFIFSLSHYYRVMVLTNFDEFVAGIMLSNIGVQAGFLIVLAIVCVSLAWLAKVKVVDPLRRKELPKHIRAWCLALSILGLFFGMIIGIVIMGYAEEKIKMLLKHAPYT
ncbi:MAG: hypothetical protein QXR97_05105 [Thermoproteota archaeon]